VEGRYVSVRWHATGITSTGGQEGAIMPDRSLPKWAREGIGEHRAVFDCPHCGVNNAMHELRSPESVLSLSHEGTRQVKGLDGSDYTVTTVREHLVYRCAGCGGDTYFLRERWGPKLEGGHSFESPSLAVDAGSAVLHQYPVGSPVYHTAVPQGVRHAAREAELCLAVGASNACGVMVRRAMEGICADKRAEGDNLFDQLKHLREKHVITPDLWEWAEELRVAGRSGAHPVWEQLNEGEALYALGLLREIVRYLYINPYERDQRRLKQTKARRE
jgi:hypothetical protein